MKWVLMMPLTAHPAARDLLDAQRVGQQGLAQAAVLLGDHQAEDPHLLHPSTISVGYSSLCSSSVATGMICSSTNCRRA
jgi:hypothetical protein